jgi:peptidyl-prolyl cis-trans isomerase SurA
MVSFMMQRKLLNLLLVCSLFCVSNAFSAAAHSSDNGESLDKIVAIVNETPITQSELDAAIGNIKKQMQASGNSTPPDDVLRKQVLDQIINRKLQLEVAENANVHVPDEQVNKAIAEIAAQNKVTIKVIYAKLASTGMSAADYRKEIREEILLQEVQQGQVGAHITIAPQEVDDFMRSAAWKAYNNKEYHLQDILVAMPDTPTTQNLVDGKKKAEDILQRLHQGASFQQVAMAESGSSGALQGGDLGWRKLPQIPAAFSDPLVHMKEGDVTGPILTPNGYHILKLAAIRDTGKAPSDADQRKQIQQLIFQRKFEEDLQSWITRLRSEAFINMHPEKTT